jgi:hypothetical protein
MDQQEADRIRSTLLSRVHCSYSFFTKLMACPAQWYGHYVLEEDSRQSGPQYLGVTVHDVLDQVNRRLVSIEAVQADYDLAWTTQRAWRTPETGDELPTPWEAIDWGIPLPDPRDPTYPAKLIKVKEKAGFFKQAGADLLDRYFGGPHRRNVPMVFNGEPLSEFQLNIDLKPYGAFRLKELIARIDLLTADGRLLDYKTKAMNPIPQSQFLWDMQPVIYTWALDEAGVISPPVTFRYAQLVYQWSGQVDYNEKVGGRVHPFKVEAFRRKVLPGMVERAETTIQLVLDHLDRGHDPLDYFERHLRTGSHCTYCDHREACPMYVDLELVA